MTTDRRIRVAALIGSAVVLAVSFALWALLVAMPSSAERTRSSTQFQQAQTIYAGGLTTRAGPTQSVRMALRGELVRVDLPLCTTIKGSVVNLTVRSSRTHRQISTVLTLRKSDQRCVWQAFDLKRWPLRAERGETLVLRVSSLRGEAPLWASNAVANDPYPQGEGFWRGHTINDFGFRTYVVSTMP